MNKSKCRSTQNIKRQGNMTPQKIDNHTTKDLNDSEGDEILSFKLKRIMIIMINEMKKEMYKHLNKIKEDTNKWLNEINKTM
jgi:hypothetical protein